MPVAPVPAGYKLTEVGVIPEDWERSSVRVIASSTRNAIVGGPFGSDLVSKDYVAHGVPVIRGQNMSGQWVSGSFVFVTPTKAKSLEANLAHPGDIIFTQRGTLGQVSLVPDKPFSAYLVSQSQMKLSVNRKVADPLFLFYFFTSYEQQKSIQGRTIQTGVPHINLGILREMPVRLPPLAEQHAIAEALSDVDGMLVALEALIAKKRAVKQAAMQQLLTGKSRLPGFSGVWETKRLGDIASFFKGSGLSKADLSLDGRRRCVHYGELFTVYGERITEVLHGTDREGIFFHSIRNDVLMPTSDVTPNGLATASCILASDIILGGDVLVIRISESVLNGEFLAYAIKIHRDQVMQLVSGTTVFHLYGRDMANFSFAVPSVDEQTSIVAILSDMDAEIAVLERRRDKTCVVKQGMMQQLLTGRVRLAGQIQIGGDREADSDE